MKKRHKQDREKVAERLDAEEDKEERVLTKELDSEREKLLREKRNRQATELSSRKDLTEEQIRDVSLFLSKKNIGTAEKKDVICLFFFFILSGRLNVLLKEEFENYMDIAFKLNRAYTQVPHPLQNYFYLYH